MTDGMLPVEFSSAAEPPYHLTIHLTSPPTSTPASAVYQTQPKLHSPVYLHALQATLTRVVVARYTGEQLDGLGQQRALANSVWSDVSATIDTEPGTDAAVEAEFSRWWKQDSAPDL